MQTLFELDADMQALDDLLTECGGDISDPDVAATIDKWMQQLDHNLNTKADGYAALITEMERRAEVRRDEAARMAKRARIDEASANWLKQALLGTMQHRGKKKLETGRFRISVAANGGKVPLVLDSTPPAVWLLPPVSPGPDKGRIREAIERGEALDFAHLGERGFHLSIR